MLQLTLPTSNTVHISVIVRGQECTTTQACIVRVELFCVWSIFDDGLVDFLAAEWGRKDAWKEAREDGAYGGETGADDTDSWFGDGPEVRHEGVVAVVSSIGNEAGLLDENGAGDGNHADTKREVSVVLR